jgi:uncharacterized protein (DUF924 family)
VDQPEDVLWFWFGELDARGRADKPQSERWFRKDHEFDGHIRDRFGALHERLLAGAQEDWRSTPRPLLAYVIVLDQFSRNLHRGSARAFAGDARALAAARDGLARGFDHALAFAERPFLYMPFMHSEALADQDECVRRFTALRDEQTDAELRGQVDWQLGYAVQHRDIIARFGRFPHRNAVLGRPSTAEEMEFLKQPGSSF